ncbi:hypothetical protein ABIA38_004724 [Embleya sp. AB8]
MTGRGPRALDPRAVTSEPAQPLLRTSHPPRHLGPVNGFLDEGIT